MPAGAVEPRDLRGRGRGQPPLAPRVSRERGSGFPFAQPRGPEIACGPRRDGKVDWLH